MQERPSETPKVFDIAFLDGDEIVYNAGFASQHKWYYVYDINETNEGEWFAKFKYKKEAVEYCNTWLGGVHKPEEDSGFGVIVPQIKVDPEGIARYNADQYIKAIKKATNAKNIVLLFSHSDNFRNDIASFQPYKGSRATAPKPVHYSEIKKHLVIEYEAEAWEYFEADDLLGCYGMESFLYKQNNVIVTNDKDLNMIPGWRYYPNKKVLTWISYQEASDFFFVQWLTGDATDDIPGIYKVSGNKVKATKKLKEWVLEGRDPFERYARVWQAYRDADCYDDEDDTTSIVLEIGRLLWMKRDRSNHCFDSFINSTCTISQLAV